VSHVRGNARQAYEYCPHARNFAASEHAVALPKGQRGSGHDKECLAGEENTEEDGQFLRFLMGFFQELIVFFDDLTLRSKRMDGFDRAQCVLSKNCCSRIDSCLDDVVSDIFLCWPACVLTVRASIGTRTEMHAPTTPKMAGTMLITIKASFH